MYLEYLSLNNFRNYEEQELRLEKEINIFMGNNAQGKTNILEAVYFLALAKSHRTSNEKELIKLGNSFSVVKGSVVKEGIDSTQEVAINERGKKVKINNNPVRRISEYIGNMNIVMFSPEDLNLVKGGPQYRRRFLDMEIGQINPIYLYHLAKYQRVLQQRNNFLKEIAGNLRGKEDVLQVWNAQLMEHGVKIILKRIEYLKLIEKWLTEIHQSICEEVEKITIEYKTTIIETETVNAKKELIREACEEGLLEYYAEALKRIEIIELRRGVTMVGPHRDDMLLNINDRNALTYGSQGQQRTLVLSLKLAELELIKHYKGEYPILLLDDVLSELDQRRQSYLLKKINNNIQTLLTTTDLSGIEKEKIKKAKIHQVKNGRLMIE